MNDSFMVKVWKTGGFIVNSHIEAHKQYYSQSGHSTCVFGKTQALKNIRFEEELWLQDTKYALPDDMVMFYKLYLQGNKIAIDRNAYFFHLDAGSSLMTEDKKLNNIYASARNGVIFWHRFIYSCQPQRFISALCISRRIFFTILFSFIKGIAYRNMSFVKTYIAGYKDAFHFLASDKYKQLPRIRVVSQQHESK